MHNKILQDDVLTAVLEKMLAPLAFHSLTQGWRLETHAKIAASHDTGFKKSNAVRKASLSVIFRQPRYTEGARFPPLNLFVATICHTAFPNVPAATTCTGKNKFGDRIGL